MSAPLPPAPEMSTRVLVACTAAAVGLLIGVLALVVYLGTRPFSDLAGANPGPVASFAPIPASSAPQAPHTPPSLTELPMAGWERKW